MEVALIRVTEDGEATPVELTRERTLIGRHEDCHIRVPAAGISRRHCEIVIDGASIEIKDLGSSNGTYVNQERVTGTALAAGDLISFGGMVFVLSVNGDPEDIDAEMMFDDGLPIDDAVPPVPSPSAPKPASKKVRASDLKDDSSMMDFEFDFDDDDDQPPL